MFIIVISTQTTEKARCETSIHRMGPHEGTYTWGGPGNKQTKRDRSDTEHWTSVQMSSERIFNIFCGLPWELTTCWNDKRRKKRWNEWMDIRGFWMKQQKKNRIVQSGTFSCGHGFLQGWLLHQSQHGFSSCLCHMRTVPYQRVRREWEM